MYFYCGYSLTVKALIMESPKEKAEKEKALKKLMARWLLAQDTRHKAGLLLDKNPTLKPWQIIRGRKTP